MLLFLLGIVYNILIRPKPTYTIVQIKDHNSIHKATNDTCAMFNTVALFLESCT